jgi:3-deoxy-D-manno-octulosonic-acid transferase
METELWPNLFERCARSSVAVILANARLSARSVASYRRFRGLFSGVFTNNVLIAAQSPSDAGRFESIGAEAARICVVGNVKFDLQLDEAAARHGRELRAAFGAERSVWIAGSTHAGEEEQLLDAQLLLLQDRPGTLLLLVPRHKQRFQAVADLLLRRRVAFVRRSAGIAPVADVNVMLVDSVGELAALYAAADVAFVGGSLVPIGGHNLLEPASLGLPVLTGPYNFNGKDIARLLFERGAALPVADARELAAALKRLFDDPDERRRIGLVGRHLVESNRGSVQRLLDLIEERLAEPRLAEPRPARSP